MKLAEYILELLYPSTCPGCGSDTSLKNLWCEECIRQFWNPRMLSSSSTKYLCGCYTLCNYTGGLRKCVIRLKYNGRAELKHAFPSLLMAFPWWERLKEYETVIPVPLSKTRFRERGYNQVDMIFRKWMETAGKIYLPYGMVRMRNTETQSLLTKEERYKNMRGVFHVNKGLSVEGKKILLVDDVYPVKEKKQTLYRIFYWKLLMKKVFDFVKQRESPREGKKRFLRHRFSGS